MTTSEILDTGMTYLVEKLGVVDAELFVTTMIREAGDYTKWRRTYFDDMTPEEFHNAAIEHAKNHPFRPNLRTAG